MTAYVLQMLFFALALFSVAVMIVMILKDVKATKKQWWWLLMPILFLFMTIAYRFDWNENTTSDLYRFFQDFEAMRRYGFDYEMRYADEFSWLWRVVAYAFSGVDNLHWFPVFAVGVDYIIFFYILTELTEKHGFSATDVVCCIMLRLSLMPLLMSISASRNAMAYSLFSLGVYMYYKYGLKNIRMYIWLLAGVLMHTTVFLGVAVFAISLLIKKRKSTIVLFLLGGVLFASVAAPTLSSSTSEFFQYFGNKWELYISAPNTYEIQKSNQIFVGLLPLFLCLATWYMSKNQSPKKNRLHYTLCNLGMTLGTYGMMAELFLRICYPTAILSPVYWAEINETQWRSHRNGRIIKTMLLGSVCLLFVATVGGWLFQIYWFFEV